MGAIKSYVPEPCQPCCVCCAGADMRENEIRAYDNALKKTIQYRNMQHNIQHNGDDPLNKMVTYDVNDERKGLDY